MKKNEKTYTNLLYLQLRADMDQRILDNKRDKKINASGMSMIGASKDDSAAVLEIGFPGVDGSIPEQGSIDNPEEGEMKKSGVIPSGLN